MLDDCNALLDNVIVKHNELKNIRNNLTNDTLKSYGGSVIVDFNGLKSGITNLIGKLNKGSSFGKKRKSKKELLMDLRKVLNI